MSARVAVGRRVRIFLLAVWLAGGTATFLPHSIAGRQTAAETAGGALVVTAVFAGRPSLAPNEPVELRTNRPLQPADGQLAVLVGDTDVTALLVIEADRVTYTPRLPLPAGETEVSVWLISAGYEWREVGRFPLRVAAAPDSTAPPASPTAGAPDAGDVPGADPARPQRKWGFDKFEPSDSLTLNLKSQPASGRFPAPAQPQSEGARARFTGLAGMTSLGVALARGALSWQNTFDLVGSTFQSEASRAGELGNAAPQLDLANYLIRAQQGRAAFSLGHVSFGAQRHLINGFSSRGLAVTLPLGGRADFSAAALNGTSIVGWGNFFGLNRRRHQVIGGTLGFEFLRQRPGGLRLEAGAVTGSLLPLNSFSGRTITDAERSLGGSVRVVAGDAVGRLRLEAGFARSRFTNPSDPLLEQGLEVVPVRATTRNARYLDAGYVLLRDLSLSDRQKLNLTFNLRHEQVDPLFRSVGAGTQADRSQNQFEVVGNVGEANFTVVHLRAGDNLADVPSILKTLTRRDALMLALPLASFISPQEEPNAWLPRLSLTVDRTHQFGASIPTGGDFRPDLVPDQVSLNHDLSAEWQFQKWRLGYRFNRSLQDNRQPGRERADLKNLINSFMLGLVPKGNIDLSFEVNHEQAHNLELGRVDRMLRFGVITNWRITPRMALLLNLSTVGAGDRARTAESRTVEGDAQWTYTYSFGAEPVKRFPLRPQQAQFFVRYANRFARTRDSVFQVDDLTKVWTLNTGLGLTF